MVHFKNFHPQMFYLFFGMVKISFNTITWLFQTYFLIYFYDAIIFQSLDLHFFKVNKGRQGFVL